MIDEKDGSERMPPGLYSHIQAMIEEQPEEGFSLSSTGPDGEEGTEDDIEYGTY